MNQRLSLSELCSGLFLRVLPALLLRFLVVRWSVSCFRFWMTRGSPFHPGLRILHLWAQRRLSMRSIFTDVRMSDLRWGILAILFVMFLFLTASNLWLRWAWWRDYRLFICYSNKTPAGVSQNAGWTHFLCQLPCFFVDSDCSDIADLTHSKLGSW